MNVAVLASGSGTILEAMLAAGVPVDLVLTDRACRATDIASAANVASVLVERTDFTATFDRDAFTSRVAAELDAADIDLVVMAGFGTVFGAPIYDRFAGRVLNTHPALLPSFPGWHAVADALAYGVKVTGCTVHVAELEVDSGPILAQRAVAVEADDTVESLHERIKVVERDLYVATVLSILDRQWILEPGDIADSALAPESALTPTTGTTTR